jgi:hypothetical protein
MELPGFISEVLDASPRAIDYEVSRRLADLFPDRALVEGSDCDFTFLTYVREGFCTIRRKAGVHGQIQTGWSADGGVFDEPKNVWYEVEWRDHRLDVLMLDWNDCGSHFWILAETETVARRFFQAVCEHDPDYHDEVLVFDGGRWDASPGLFRSLRQAASDDLLLPGTLKADLLADVERFFVSRDLYESLGVVWKRGLLLTGPPGNGKTLWIKSAVARIARPCVYVKSFKSERLTEESNIRRIFTRARRVAPCLVVLEDLDALVTGQNRSFLLNELDGFASNTGILTLATTNHPERLDPALADRPSRFDRIYRFPRPDADCRRAFLDRWLAHAPNRLGATVDDASRAEITVATEGFSFAHLKELLLSALQALAAGPPGVCLAEILTNQAAALGRQMRRTAEAADAEPDAQCPGSE